MSNNVYNIFLVKKCVHIFSKKKCVHMLKQICDFAKLQPSNLLTNASKDETKKDAIIKLLGKVYRNEQVTVLVF